LYADRSASFAWKKRGRPLFAFEIRQLGLNIRLDSPAEWGIGRIANPRTSVAIVEGVKGSVK